MPFIVVFHLFQERMAFWEKCLLLSFLMCFKERLAFCGKCLLSSWVHDWGASGILREMTFIVLNLWLRRMWEMPLIVVCNVNQNRLAFWMKCLLSPFLMCFNSVYHFTGNAFERPDSMFEERLAFCRKSLWSSWVYVWGASGFLREMPFILFCDLFEERMAF